MTDNLFLAEPATSRRGFLRLMVGVLSALVAAAVAVPLIGAIIGPSFRMKKSQWVKVGASHLWPLNSLPI